MKGHIAFLYLAMLYTCFSHLPKVLRAGSQSDSDAAKGTACRLCTLRAHRNVSNGYISLWHEAIFSIAASEQKLLEWIINVIGIGFQTIAPALKPHNIHQQHGQDLCIG